METDEPFHYSSSANSRSLSCCLIDNGIRCTRPTGNASYSKRIAKMVQQRRLKLSLDHAVRFISDGVLPLDEAITSRAVFVIVSRTGERTETLLEPAK